MVTYMFQTNGPAQFRPAGRDPIHWLLCVASGLRVGFLAAGWDNRHLHDGCRALAEKCCKRCKRWEWGPWAHFPRVDRVVTGPPEARDRGCDRMIWGGLGWFGWLRWLVRQRLSKPWRIRLRRRPGEGRRDGPSRLGYLARHRLLAMGNSVRNIATWAKGLTTPKIEVFRGKSCRHGLPSLSRKKGKLLRPHYSYQTVQCCPPSADLGVLGVGQMRRPTQRVSQLRAPPARVR